MENIKSANILLTDWKAKMSNFEFSSLDSLHQHIDHVSNHAYGKRSEDHSQTLGPLAKTHFKEGNFNEMVFESIKQEIVPESYSSFVNIAYECLRDDGYERPEAREVVIQLKETGKDNAMISATMFSYGNRTSHKWRYIQRSRFHKVAKMMDMTTLEIQIKIKTEILSRDIVYGVHLVFKFSDPGKMKKEEIKILNGNQQVPKPDVNEDQMQQRPNDLGETIYVQSEVNGKKHLMISATKVLFNSHKMKFFHRKPSAESRFQNVMELLPQQVFRIKYKIESEMLSPFTEYVCYLVFKLSEKCRELHCPVKVRDLLHRRNKETKNLYFRTSAPFNRH
ncbi:kinase-like domain, phloem protein 2-like protein [Tanacetum coccineum]